MAASDESRLSQYAGGPHVDGFHWWAPLRLCVVEESDQNLATKPALDRVMSCAGASMLVIAASHGPECLPGLQPCNKSKACSDGFGSRSVAMLSFHRLRNPKSEIVDRSSTI